MNICILRIFLVPSKLNFKMSGIRKLPDVQRSRKLQSHNEKKNQLTETNSGMTQMVEL